MLEYVTGKGLGTRVIVTSSGDPSAYADAVKQKGAFGYFQKSKPLQKLVELVRAALATQQP